MLRDEDKKRIAVQAQAYADAIFADGDATEALAGLYATAQLIERVLLECGLCTIEHVVHIQAVGKRIGASMTPRVDLNLVRKNDVQ